MEVSMFTQTITSAWQNIINYFFPVFTAPTAEIFASLVTGWVLCTCRRTVCGMLLFADPMCKKAHDAYHRFFPDASWNISSLWKMLALLLVKIFYPTGTIPTDLDDTVFRRCGRKVNGAGWWRDPVRSCDIMKVFGRGLNLVVLTLRIYPRWGGEPIALPINMRLHRKGGPTPTQLAEKMLNELANWLPQRRFICHCDGFYTALTDCHMERTAIISRMRRDAWIYQLPPVKQKPGPGRRRKRGDRLPPPSQLVGRIKQWRQVKTLERGVTKKRLVYSMKVIWYHVSRKPVFLVISRDPAGKERDDFFFTTDLTLTAAEVIGGFAGRWSIEDTFRNTKQLIGGQQPQTWKGRGPERAAAMSLWLYSTVWLWYLQKKRLWNRLPTLPWYRAKARPSFADALSALRRSLWRERIKSMFDNSTVHNKITDFLIAALSAAA